MTAPPLGSRFWRMYTATASSDLADGIGRAALPLAAAAYTRNPLAIAGIMTFGFLPWLLFALPSGALVDRVDRRNAMAAANVGRAVTAAGLATAILCGAGSVWLLYVGAFLLGAAETVYDNAVRALLPQVVGTAQLDRANSLVTVEETVAQTFAGAPLGAAIFTVAIGLPFVLNAVGFALAVLLIAGLRGSYRPHRAAPPAAVHTEIAEGVRWLRGHALLRGLTLISAAEAFANAMVSSVLVLYVLEVLRLPPRGYGLILLAGGVGAAIGGLGTPPLARRFGRPAALTLGSVLNGLSMIALATTRNGYLAGVLFGAGAAAILVWNVLTMSLRQALIPSELFGRVQGAYRTLVWGGIPLGSLTGGAIADAAGVRSVYVVAGAITLVMGVLLGRLVYRHAEQISGELVSATS